MLGVSQYPQDYIDQCRAQIDGAIAAYTDFAAGAKNGAAFEPVFFNNLVIALDHRFVHRVRKAEGKDGNPLNEVRMLSDSLMENGGVLAANSTIKWKADASVLGYEVGDEIKVSADGFRRLADGFFKEIESRFT